MAKEVMAGQGIPVPRGRVATTPEEAAEIASGIGEVAIKSQILSGGRGKAGGIAFAATPDEARTAAKRLLGAEIRGLKVERVLVEEKLQIDHELYVSITVDSAARLPLVMASMHGGINIEEVPEKHIIKQHVDPVWGLYPYEGRQLAQRLGLGGSVAKQFAALVVKLYRVFADNEAELVEINPLVVSEGRLLAADGRLNVDDEALFRQSQLPVVEEGSALERDIKELGLSFVQLDGDIAVMANGAGITMATLDIISAYGGSPANFLDAGGGASVEPTAKAIEVLLRTEPSVILINIFGGITRCDDVATALVQVKKTRGIPVPVVIRLVGTNEEAGVRILQENGFEAYSSLDEAAKKAVELSRAGGEG